MNFLVGGRSSTWLKRCFCSTIQKYHGLTVAEMKQRVHQKKGIILDMDGVIYHGESILPGVDKFLGWLQESGKKFIFLTNSSERTPQQLSDKLKRLTGREFIPSIFHTCALSTGHFVTSQMTRVADRPARVYIIGEQGLRQALIDEGHIIADTEVDYVIVGETVNYNYDKIVKAAELVRKGARLIGTNKDIRDRMHDGFVPSTGSLICPIELTSNKKAYFVGKPNPLIMTHALKKFEQLKKDEVVIIGDNMDTDIAGGVEADIDTVLVLTGVTSKSDLGNFAFRPTYIFDGLGDLVL